MSPVISIIITCYNDGEFLPVCINSIEKIKAAPKEVIIVNDGSTDERTLILLGELKASGYKVIDQANQGSSKARNTGIAAAAAPYILLIDSDDFIEPELVHEGIRILDEQPGTGVVYSDVATFGKETTKRHLPEFDFARLLTGNYVYISSVFRKSIWEQNNGFDENPKLKAHQDWDFWIMTAKSKWHFHHIKKCLFHYRIRSHSVSSMAHDPDVQKEINQYITTKHADVYREHALFITRFLKETIHDLAGTVKMLDQNTKAYAEKVASLERRIGFMETSRIVKFRFFMSRVKTILVSGDKDSKGKISIVYKIFFFISSRGRKLVKDLLKKVYKKLKVGSNTKPSEAETYKAWISRYEPGTTGLSIMKSRIMEFHDKPVISVFVAINRPEQPFLIAMIESLMDQIYPHWELFLCMDGHADEDTVSIMQQYAKDDRRIKVAPALSISFPGASSGDFVLFCGQDDLLSPIALFKIAELENENPQADLIYADEDQVDEHSHRLTPLFKPEWSPDHLLAGNYIGRPAAMRRTLVKKTGGLRKGFEGSEEYDLLLRLTEATGNIFHIARVLYHKRTVKHRAEVVADYGRSQAIRNACKSLTESLARRGEPGTANVIPGVNGNFSVRYQVKEYGKVTVIIPTRNKADVLETCLKSIFEKTIYPNYEVVVADNRSHEPTLFHLINFFEKAEPERFRCIRLDMDFNFSKLMNESVRQTDGEYLLMLNNDTEVLVADWMDAMVEQAQRKSIGAVGAKLLYHNDTVQHGGVIIGIGGVADHAFAGIHRDGPSYQNYVNLVRNYSAVTAACMMCRRQVYNEVGGFDEGFAVEFNDVDFCLKLITAGYYNVYLPHVVLYHYESLTRGHPKSTRESFKRHLTEVARFRDRWKKFVDNDPFFNPNLSLNNNDFRIKVN